MKICLTILIGLPGSGKTTFAQTLKNNYKYHDGEAFQFINICYDELLPYISDTDLRENEKIYKKLRNNILNDIDSLILSLKFNCFDSCPEYFKHDIKTTELDSTIVIVVDDNMYLRSMRYEFFKLAKKYQISFCEVYFQCSVEQAIERNLVRTSKEIVSAHVIREMSIKMEPPSTANKWEQYFICFELCQDNFVLYTEYFNLLKKSLENPECVTSEAFNNDRDKSVDVCMNSVLHQSDIALRQIIAAKFKKFLSDNKSFLPPKNLKHYSAELNATKRRILKGIRSGSVQLPENVLNENKINNELNKKSLKLFLENIFDN